MANAFRKAGEFCWINMLTPNPAEGMEFFAAVLGWTYFEMPGYGHGIRAGGRNIGGLFDLHGPKTPPGLPPSIGVMVKVESADAICEKVAALGGTARPAFDIGDQGRMAVCHDPNGAEFDVWEAKAMPGTDADRSVHGVPSWTESMTTDVPRASAFYAELFGWTPEVKPMPGFDYTVFKREGVDVAGMMPVPPGKDCVPPHWGTYFTVNDTDEAVRIATERGGKLFVPPMDIPGIGRFSGIESPQGVRFFVIQYLPRQRENPPHDQRPSAVHARALNPILNVSNIGESVAWFEKLGWKKGFDWGSPPTFGSVRCGECEVFLCQGAQGGRGKSTLPTTKGQGEAGDKGVWMAIWVDDVDAAHRHCLAAGIEVTHPPTDEPWNVREMHIRHPDGHVFRISKAIGRAKPTSGRGDDGRPPHPGSATS